MSSVCLELRLRFFCSPLTIRLPKAACSWKKNEFSASEAEDMFAVCGGKVDEREEALRVYRGQVLHQKSSNRIRQLSRVDVLKGTNPLAKCQKPII